MDADPPVRLELMARRAWHHGQPLHLPRLQFDLLAYLAARAGQVVSTDAILRDVWGFERPSKTKTVSMHVSLLRQSLGDDAENPCYITTVRGVGLRLELGTVEIFQREVEPRPEVTRVVLVRPGDVLVFGNVGSVSESTAATANALRDQLALRQVVLFQADIDMAALPGGAL
ncbi:winged helix-turn-helix domain-containing protein [[Actinomadura] parvosata]|uniref:winged helix-turn-helix domain-containing protein n=1 Tax=[Actinomadura] parvosata TaxID=1955412 RepID=UPI00406C4129